MPTQNDMMIENNTNEPILHFTDHAVEHIRKIIARRPNGGLGFRLSIKLAGCTGYKYQPEIVEERIPEDYAFVTTQGLSVFVNNDCVEIVRGTVVALLDKGPGQSQLVYQNPNIDSECGCGESFYLKQKNSEDS